MNGNLFDNHRLSLKYQVASNSYCMSTDGSILFTIYSEPNKPNSIAKKSITKSVTIYKLQTISLDSEPSVKAIQGTISFQQNQQCFDSSGNPISKGIIRDNFTDRFIEVPCENGRVEGIAKTYYKDGRHYEIPYKNGNREGLVKQYYSFGGIEKESPYKNDKAEGITKIYFEDGGLNQEIPYKNNKREGAVSVYRKNGKLFMTVTFQNDKAVSGICHLTNGNNVPLTNAEISNLNNEKMITCP